MSSVMMQWETGPTAERRYAEGKQAIINKQSSQIIGFYEGTSLNGFTNIRRIK